MRGSSFGYLVGQGIKGTWVNRMMSAASIGILVACLVIVGGAGLLAVNVKEIFTAIESQNEIVVFVADDATEEQTEKLGKNIKAIENIESMTYVSKEEALEEEKDYMGDQGYLLDGLEDDNPLPASYRITIDGLENIDQVLSDLKKLSYVDSISAPTDLADTLSGIEKTLLVLGSIIIGILIVASTVVISNTVRLTLHARRREISIMKYVGATDTFIKFPFVVEGITIGVISAGIAFGIISAIYESLGEMLSGSSISWLTGVSAQILPYEGLWQYVLIGFVAVGVLLGAFGSSSSMRRYLRV